MSRLRAINDAEVVVHPSFAEKMHAMVDAALARGATNALLIFENEKFVDWLSVPDDDATKVGLMHLTMGPHGESV